MAMARFDLPQKHTAGVREVLAPAVTEKVAAV
jgi:hypothetical protein